MRFTPPPRPGPRGRASLVMLCIVILALLVPAWLSRVSVPRLRGSAPDTASADSSEAQAGTDSAAADSAATDGRGAGGRGGPADDVQIAGVEDTMVEALTGAPRSGGPAARAGTGRRASAGAAPRGGGTMTGVRVRQTRVIRRTTEPLVPNAGTPQTTPTAPGAPAGPYVAPPPPRATESAGNFTVFSMGDEELAPLTTFDSEHGTMLPLSDVASLLGATVTVRDGILSLQLAADDPVATTLSTGTMRGTRKAHGQAESIALSEGQLVERDGQWYATVDALRTLSALDMSFDARTQSVVITSPRAMIPRYAAGARRVQRQRRALTEAREAAITAKPAVNARIANGRFLPRLAALTYSVSQDNANGAWSGQGTLGASLLGGGLSVTGSTWSGQTAQFRPDVTWLGGDPLSRFITQARVGYGPATGLAPMPGYGFAISNAPFSRPMGLGAVPVRGTAMPGAEIEIQSGGRLLGVVTADANGQWQAPVEVGFGQNLLEISTYTPYGVSRRTELLSLDGDHIPGGKVEYGLTGQRTRSDEGTCASMRCGDMGNLDVRWGVTPKLTVRAGASALLPFDSSGGARAATLYGSLVAAPTSWLQLRHTQGGLTWGMSRAIVQPSLALRAEIGREQFSGAVSDAPFWQSRRATTIRSESWTSLTWRPVRNDLGRLWVSAIGRTTSGVRLNSTQGSLVAGGRVIGALVTVGTDRTVVSPVGTSEAVSLAHLTGSVTIPQLRRGPAWLATSFLTVGSTMQLGNDRTPTWRAGMTTTIMKSLMLQLGAEWRPGTSPSLRVQFQQHSRSALLMQSLATASAGRTRVSGSTTVLGSVLMPLDGRSPSLTSDLVALRARVRVVAFLDANNNGRRDSTEAAIPELPIRVGTQRTNTDTDGAAQVEGLQVLDAIPVRPDQGTVADIDGAPWTMSGPAPWARLVPYGETLVYLPYVRAAHGTVALDADVAGSNIWLSSLDDVTLFDIPHRTLDPQSIAIGPTRPGRYRLEARLAGDDSNAVPWGRCVLTLVSTEVVRVRIPVGSDSPDVPCLIAAAPPPP